MAAMNLQLMADIRPMSLDCAPADAELLGNLLARLVVCDHGEYASFGRCHNLQSGVGSDWCAGVATALDQIGCQRWAGVMLSPGDCPDAAHDIGHRAVLEHISLHIESERAAKKFFFAVHRQEDDFY